MAFKMSNKIILLFTIIMHTAKLNSQPAMGFIPLQPSKELQKCWSYLEQKPKCLMQIHGSLFNGQFKGISPTCCNVTAELNNDCWPILFPFHPFFPPLLKTICAHSSGLVAPTNTQFGYLNISKVVLEGAGLLPYHQQNEIYGGCLAGIESCISGLYKTLFWGDLAYLTVGCCKAIIAIAGDCLFRLFPFNPVLPKWLLNGCAAKRVYHLITNHVTKINNIPRMLPMQQGPKSVKCWSQLINNEYCLVGIYGALSGGFGFLGPHCCMAVTRVNHDCWPIIFPMNPLFPEFLLKSACAGGGLTGVLASSPQ